jgi:hypothetical protein
MRDVVEHILLMKYQETFATISLFFLALDFLFVHCSTRVFSFPLPHANRPLKMPIATTAAQKLFFCNVLVSPQVESPQR